MPTIIKLRVLFAIAIVSALCTVPAVADPPSQVGRLSLISGFISFRPGSLDEWAPGTLNYPLTAGDHLWTDSGARAEVHLVSAVVRLDSNTEFSFLSLDDETVQIRVSGGSVNVGLRSVDYGTTFEIDTPNATVILTSAGSYRLDVHTSGETSVMVRSGRAEMTVGRYVYEVQTGQTAIVSSAGRMSYYEAQRPDEWDSWNAIRDRREAQAAANPYVSIEMIGIEDLDENGTWRVEAGYGWTWTPTGVPSGWAPYRFGHWAWVNPWGWTWIDEAPWGFAPFHYGRWAFLRARWVWIPGASAVRPVYAPALVVFVGGTGWRPAAGEGIGWIPLGPREVYIPPYQVSASYVQRINGAAVPAIDQRSLENYDPGRAVYVNRGVPQGVTYVPLAAFVQSRSAGSAVLSISVTETRQAPVMGMTARVAPQRASIIGRTTETTAPVPQPPADLMSRNVYSRTAPQPAPVPFIQLQQALEADPGRPVDPAAVSSIQQRQQSPARPVTVINPASVTRANEAPATRNATQAPSLARAPTDKNAAGAIALIGTLRARTLPDADRRLLDARKVAGIRLDFNSVGRQIEAARVSLAGADRDVAGQRYEQALKTATAIQKQIGDLMKQVSAAVEAAQKQPKGR